jgi:Ca-activated chloride channel family protein
LKGGKFTGKFSYGDVAKLAQGARGEDRFGYRSEFLSLVNLAQSLGEAGSRPKHLSSQ